MDVMTAKQAAQEWQRGAERALKAAKDMLATENYELALFICHLATEKALKGLYVQKNDAHAPKIHNLEELAVENDLNLTEEERLELRELTAFCEFGRYGDAGWLQVDATKNNVEHWIERARYFVSLCEQ